MQSNLQRPKKRSPLRIWSGTQVYTLKRRLEWMTDKRKYVSKRNPDPMPYLIHTHRTPLYRQLRDVDMEFQHNKVTNLKIAIAKLNGSILTPNDVLSYWKMIGKKTKRKGYVDGMILHYGKVTSGIGVGLCQLSNLIYWRSPYIAHWPWPNVIVTATMCSQITDGTNLSGMARHVLIIISTYKSQTRRHKRINSFYI